MEFVLLCSSLPVKMLAENVLLKYFLSYEMNTSNEVPPVRGDALGLMTFLVSEDRSELPVSWCNLTDIIPRFATSFWQRVSTTGSFY